MAAKHVFPMSLEQFKATVKDPKAFAPLNNVAEGDLEYAYGCLKMGWLNKRYHKDKQDRDREQDRMIQEAIAKDPSLAKRLGLHEKAKGV